MEVQRHSPWPSQSWLAICLALLVLVPAASTQDTFAFLQPLPTPVQCQTYAFAWTGGTPTYTLSISVSLPWNASYGIYPLGGQGFPWVMPVPAGHTVSFELRDNASHVASAGPLTIQPSDDTSCFDSTGTTSSKKSSTTTTSSTTTSSTTTSSTATSSPTQTPTSTSTTATTPTSESPSTSPTSTSTSSTSSSFTPFIVSQSPTSQPPSASDGNGSTSIITTFVTTPTTGPSNASPTPRSATLSSGAIAGIAVGGAAVLVLAGVVIWFCRRRKRQPSFRPETKAMGLDTSTDPDTISRLHLGGPQMSEAVTSAQRLGPHPVLAPSSSSSSGSDPFASSDGDGSRQLLLPTGSEDYVPASFRGQQDGTAAHSRNLSLPSESSPPLPIGIHDHSLAVDDSMPKPSVADDTPAIASLHALGVDPKPDSQSSPRDLPLPPPLSHPPRGPERIGIAQSYAAVPTDERSAASGVGAPARLMRFEEDGGVRLAGGLPGEVLDEDGDDSGGWAVQPPPYQRFR